MGQWRLLFRPGIWERDVLTKVPAPGPDSWPLSDAQVRKAVAFARAGGFWDDLWTPAEFSSAPRWTVEWAALAASGSEGRQYDYWLVDPDGCGYTENEVQRGEADADLRRSGLL